MSDYGTQKTNDLRIVVPNMDELLDLLGTNYIEFLVLCTAIQAVLTLFVLGYLSNILGELRKTDDG
jgi:hypothetical protein